MPRVNFMRRTGSSGGVPAHPASRAVSGETKGVYIQDVILPEDLVRVLTEREIANQEIETYKRQKEAEDQRIDMEQAKGTADMQADLAKSRVGIDIKSNNATGRKAEADGEATYIRETGAARGAEVEAVGLARAAGYEAQVRALGASPTAIVNIAGELAARGARFVPEILVTGSGGGGAFEALAGALMRFLDGARNGSPATPPPSPASPAPPGRPAGPDRSPGPAPRS
jgi:hypothetical protein